MIAALVVFAVVVLVLSALAGWVEDEQIRRGDWIE
jgi:hypothetical protein